MGTGRVQGGTDPPEQTKEGIGKYCKMYDVICEYVL